VTLQSFGIPLNDGQSRCCEPRGRCRAKRERPQPFSGLLPESQGRDPALTVLYVPSSLDSCGTRPPNQTFSSFTNLPVQALPPLETAGTPILKPGPCTSRQNIRTLPKDPPNLRIFWRIFWQLADLLATCTGPWFEDRGSSSLEWNRD
jgi:hypothetical protein